MRVSGYPSSPSNTATLYGLVGGASRQLLAAVFQQTGGFWVLDGGVFSLDPATNRVCVNGTTFTSAFTMVNPSTKQLGICFENGGPYRGYIYLPAPGNDLVIHGIGDTEINDVNGGRSGTVILRTSLGSNNGTPQQTFDVVRASAGGRCGIMRNAASNALEVEGNASKTASGDWLANSDARIKRDVHAIEGALAKLEACNPVEFRYTETYRAAHPSIPDRPHLGVVAQEFRDVFPDYVYDAGERVPGEAEDAPNMLQVDTFPLTIVTAAAVKELAAIVRAQAAEIESLRRAIGALTTGSADPRC